MRTGGNPDSASELSEVALGIVAAERDRWHHVTRSTDRCERPRAEAAVRAAYRSAGYDEPAIVWRDSPVGGAIAAMELGFGTRQLEVDRRHRFHVRLEEPMRELLGHRSYERLHSNLTFKLTDLQWHWDKYLDLGYLDAWDTCLRHRLGRQRFAELTADGWSYDHQGRISNPCWDRRVPSHAQGHPPGPLWDQIGADVDPWRDSNWIALYTSALRITDREIPERLRTFAEAVAQVGWWWPMRDVAVLTDRPIVLHDDAITYDDQGRARVGVRPFVVYSDGFSA